MMMMMIIINKLSHSIMSVTPLPSFSYYYCICIGDTMLKINLFTVESNMNLTDQTVMRSFYKAGKILYNGQWERPSPRGRRIWKAKLSERYYLSAIISFSKFSRTLDNVLLGL